MCIQRGAVQNMLACPEGLSSQGVWYGHAPKPGEGEQSQRAEERATHSIQRDALHEKGDVRLRPFRTVRLVEHALSPWCRLGADQNLGDSIGRLGLQAGTRAMCGRLIQRRAFGLFESSAARHTCGSNMMQTNGSYFLRQSVRPGGKSGAGGERGGPTGGAQA